MSELKEIKLVPSQQKVFDQLVRFISSDSQRVFILKGYAGTGKTTLMRFLIADLNKKNRPYRLLASTGRAAKILTNLVGGDQEATTIHSMIYSFNGLNQDLSDADISNKDVNGQLFIVFSPCTIKSEAAPHDNMVYIIDESSMVADHVETNITQACFGSGRLLKELLDYDPRPESKFIFVGDPCQLPPIKEVHSPALSPDYFKQVFRFDANEAQLTEIMRQSNGNDIVPISQQIRKRFAMAPNTREAYRGITYRDYLPFSNSNNITLHPNLNSMIDHYVGLINDNGYNHSICISRSNKGCFYLSRRIRRMLGIQGDVIGKRDLLMVVQNNPCGLMNGDMVEVVSMSQNVRFKAGLHFREVEVRELFTHVTRKLLMLEDTLYTEQPNLSAEQQKGLFIDFVVRMKEKGIKQHDRAFEDQMRRDPYLNSLRCNYGYAVTCHKAQGGEWNEVYIDLADNFMWQPTKSTYQWIYTAMTRAKNQLHLVKGYNIQR